MSLNKSFLNKIKRPILIGSFFVLLALISIVFASRILYNRTVDLLTDNLRQRILTVSVTVAANLSANDINALNVEDDWKKPEWSKIVGSLNKSKYSNKDIVFMYIFRKTKSDPSKMEFVADADSINPYANSGSDSDHYIDVNRDGIIEPEGPDKLQWPGQPYPEAADIPETFDAYNGPITSKDLYKDEYGTVLTGYAPIKDQFGNTVAVLATDIKADDFFKITTQTLRPFILFILFLMLVIFLLTAIIFFVWNRYTLFLENTNLRLKTLDKQKTEFVSLASHQLRAPMTAIKGYSAMILDNDYGEVPELIKEPLHRIFTSTKSLIQIVSDFLDVTRIELGTMKFTFTDFDLRDLVNDSVNEMSPNINNSKVEFKFDIPSESIFIHGDSEKIKQVVNNLIDNSIKYTKDGCIHIILEKSGSTCRFMIKDTGVGISPESLPRLFDKFIRADNANQANVIGTGLGLYVARQMIQKHKGRIWAESEGVGKGSAFIFEIDGVK